MNISSACYVATKTINTELYPAWVKSERFSFVDNFSAVLKALRK